MKNLLLLLFSCVFFSSNAQPDWFYVQNLNDWEDLLELSKAHKRNIFLYYSESECEDCKLMLESTLSNSNITKVVNNNFIAARVNSSSSLGRQFGSVFQLSHTPSVVWINGDEFVWKRVEGYRTVAEFNQELDDLKYLINNYPDLLQYAFYSGDSLRINQWMELLDICALNNTDYQVDIHKSLERSLNWDSLASPRYWDYINTYVSDLHSPVFKYIAADPKGVLGEEFDFESFYASVYDVNFHYAAEAKDSMHVLEMESYLLPIAPHDSSATKVDSALLVIHLWQEYFLSLEDFDAYKTYTDTSIAKLKLTAPQLTHQVNTLLRHSLSETSLRLALKWVNATLEHETDEVDLYIMKADILIGLREYTKAKETLLKCIDKPATDSQRESMEYLMFIIESQY